MFKTQQNPSKDNLSNFVYDKKNYTHGFEDIYALEKIDVRSIKKVSILPKEVPSIKPLCKDKKEPAVELDLQTKFSFIVEEEVINNFKLFEPILVLQLSLQAEKRLYEAGLKTINDIYELKKKGFNHLKTLGQGHLDEIDEKLLRYVGAYQEKKSFIDFSSIIKCLVGSLENKAAFLILNSYKLSHLISITPAERMNVRHIQGLKKQEVLEKAIIDLKSIHNNEFAKVVFDQIYNVFIQSWILKRFELVTYDEIIERVLKKSTDSEVALSSIDFLSDYFFNKALPFLNQLIKLDSNLFTSSSKVENDFNTLKDVAISYFYSPNVFYELDELVLFILRELASKWVLLDEGFVRKSLHNTSCFIISKDERGKKIISLNFYSDLIIKN
jgi:hypothetical protein